MVVKQDLKKSKEKIKDLMRKQKDSLRDFTTTDKARQHLEIKVQGLTDGLTMIEENAEPVDQENKLKNIIFILIRENKELKNQLHLIELSSQNL